MNEHVTDMHALYWYLRAAPQLSAKARAVFLAGKQGQARIHIPSIVLAELYYLNVKYNEGFDTKDLQEAKALIEGLGGNGKMGKRIRDHG